MKNNFGETKINQFHTKSGRTFILLIILGVNHVPFTEYNRVHYDLTVHELSFFKPYECFSKRYLVCICTVYLTQMYLSLMKRSDIVKCLAFCRNFDCFLKGARSLNAPNFS